MNDDGTRAALSRWPPPPVAADHVAPCGRRVRATLGGETVVDTTRALYVWEWPAYPQYYVPLADVRAGALAAETGTETTSRGIARVHALHAAGLVRESAAHVLDDSPIAGLANTVRFEFDDLDAWFEEDERIFVHPRNPYARVDALRSRRTVRVELGGELLAESASVVMVFETGLPTRTYFDRSDVRFERLVPSETRSACPYKGRTTDYWSVFAGGEVHDDLAWSYDFPTAALLPIAGLVAFLDERVDVTVDGVRRERPVTHMG